jgi:hypothetical protein
LIYLSGLYNRILPQYRAEFGYMLNVNKQMGQEREAMQYTWMLDNGAFGKGWRVDTWRRRLEQLAPYHATCIGAVVPDVVGDAVATLARWHTHAPIVKALGYKAAFATQDGCLVESVPWPEIDVLFVGGSNDHKRVRAWPLINEARRLGIWCHVGRVNSARSISCFRAADSVDGTHFRFEASQQEQERILWAVRRCNKQIEQEPLFMLDS